MLLPSNTSVFSDWEWLAEVFWCIELASERCITEHANVLESTKPLTHSNFSFDGVKSEDLEEHNSIQEFPTSGCPISIITASPRSNQIVPSEIAPEGSKPSTIQLDALPPSESNDTAVDYSDETATEP